MHNFSRSDAQQKKVSVSRGGGQGQIQDLSERGQDFLGTKKFIIRNSALLCSALLCSSLLYSALLYSTLPIYI